MEQKSQRYVSASSNRSMRENQNLIKTVEETMIYAPLSLRSWAQTVTKRWALELQSD
jgi:hypothetical protein